MVRFSNDGAAQPVPVQLGGTPSKGTPKDKRLKENKPKPVPKPKTG